MLQVETATALAKNADMVEKVRQLRLHEAMSMVSIEAQLAESERCSAQYHDFCTKLESETATLQRSAMVESETVQLVSLRVESKQLQCEQQEFLVRHLSSQLSEMSEQHGEEIQAELAASSRSGRELLQSRVHIAEAEEERRSANELQRSLEATSIDNREAIQQLQAEVLDLDARRWLHETELEEIREAAPAREAVDRETIARLRHETSELDGRAREAAQEAAAALDSIAAQEATDRETIARLRQEKLELASRERDAVQTSTAVAARGTAEKKAIARLRTEISYYCGPRFGGPRRTATPRDAATCSLAHTGRRCGSAPSARRPRLRAAAPHPTGARDGNASGHATPP